MYMMHPYYYSTGYSWGFGLLPFLVVPGFIFLVWAIFSHHNDSQSEEEQNADDTALQILRERYAKGDITKRQFDQMKKDLNEES